MITRAHLNDPSGCCVEDGLKQEWGDQEPSEEAGAVAQTKDSDGPLGWKGGHGAEGSG